MDYKTRSTRELDIGGLFQGLEMLRQEVAALKRQVESFGKGYGYAGYTPCPSEHRDIFGNPMVLPFVIT